MFSGDRLLLFENVLDDDMSPEVLNALTTMIDRRRRAKRG
jgi:hypothetical protein